MMFCTRLSLSNDTVVPAGKGVRWPSGVDLNETHSLALVVPLRVTARRLRRWGRIKRTAHHRDRYAANGERYGGSANTADRDNYGSGKHPHDPGCMDE
jgi:hypothetical protein